MISNDHIQPFIFEHADIRGTIIHIENTYQNILQKHNYPQMVKKLLAEVILSNLLLAHCIKFKGSISMQFQGDNRLPLLLTQCNHKFEIRGFAKCERDLKLNDYASAFLNGQLAVTINQDNSTKTYQSKVKLTSTSMSENLTTFFAQSEQITTQVWLASTDKRAAAMMLQLMPDQKSLQREEFWEYATKIGQTLTNDELLNLDNKTLIHRLYHETDIRLFDSKPTTFNCGCSKEKMKQVLLTLGEDDAQKLLKEEGEIKVSCDFCNTHYSFDSIDIAQLFHH